jgi:hypothetical protein
MPAEKDIAFDSSWIHNLEAEAHWRSYWLQQKMMQDYLERGDRILEIGVGSGFCANYLKSKGHEVVTLDIDAEKKPDIVANICEFELKDDYDHVLAFETFEHFPFGNLFDVLSMLASHTRKYLFVSVPESRKVSKLNIKIPLLPPISCSIRIPNYKLPRFLRRDLSSDKYHHWEINYSKEFSIDKVKAMFAKAGFTVEKHRISHFNNHNFFVLGRNKQS